MLYCNGLEARGGTCLGSVAGSQSLGSLAEGGQKILVAS